MARKKQKPLTQKQLTELSEAYRLHNKQMKQSNNRRLCFSSLEDYLDWRFGRTPASTAGRPSRTRTMRPARSYERSTRAQAIPSRLHQELPSDRVCSQTDQINHLHTTVAIL